jgi:hypothetical protein
MLGGMTLALVFYFPGFHLLERAANPALAEASARAPVTVTADPKDCALQFDPVGKAAFVSSCDIAKSALANAGISYANQKARPASAAVVQVGGVEVVSQSAKGLPPRRPRRSRPPARPRSRPPWPGRLSGQGRSGAHELVGHVRGAVGVRDRRHRPVRAAGRGLVELFPTRVRYTALSLPYHIGTGWIGGFVPFSAFAIVTAVGNIYAGLWYPVVFTLISVLTTLFLLPETKDRSLD